MKENEMRGKERLKCGGGVYQSFLASFSLGKEEQGKEGGRISGRGSAGVVPPDLDPFLVFLFLLCLLS